jgi:hypothetical protein
MKNASYAEKTQSPGLTAQRQVHEAGQKDGRMEGWGGPGPAGQDKLPATAGSSPRHVLSNLPAEPGARALRQAAVLQMQRERGNAYVAQVVQPSPIPGAIQRAIEIGEVESTVEGGTPGTETTAGEPTPTEMTAGGSAVRVTPGGVEVSGGMVNVDAPMTRFSGAVQSDTVIANSVVASNYTPGAGNVW